MGGVSEFCAWLASADESGENDDGCVEVGTPGHYGEAARAPDIHRSSVDTSKEPH